MTGYQRDKLIALTLILGIMVAGFIGLIFVEADDPDREAAPCRSDLLICRHEQGVYSDAEALMLADMACELRRRGEIGNLYFDALMIVGRDQDAFVRYGECVLAGEREGS